MPESQPPRHNRLGVVPLSDFVMKPNLFGDPLLSPYSEDDGFMQTAKAMIMADLEPSTRYSAALLYEKYLEWAARARRRPITAALLGRNLTKLGFTAVQSTVGRCWVTPPRS